MYFSENTRVERAHDGSGQPDERNSSTAHTVKEQHAHEVHREIASFNTDNEFIRKINEEDIDFNILHVGCAFNLHSIINSGVILGGQSSSKRQTVFFLLVDLMDQNHKDPDVIDLSVPRHA